MQRSAIVFLLLFAASANAVHNDRRFERVGRAEGLSEISVRAIAQDRRGFIWLGTAEGLNRFDGRAMVVYRRNPSDRWSLGSNRISALLVDSRGTLWVGTRGGGLSRFDATMERFETFRFDPKDPSSLSQNDVAAIAEDRRGRIWVGTTRGGLNRIDLGNAAKPRFIRYQRDPDDASSLSDDRTRALLVDRSGRLWIATMGGINRLVSESPARFAHYRHDPFRPDSLSDDEVWALAEDRDGTIWAGSWGGGLSRLDADAVAVPGGRFVNTLPDAADPFSLSDSRVMSILEDRDGTLWIGTLAQLNELLPSEKRRARPRFIRHANDPSSPHSLADDEMTSAFEDRDGDLWFGTARGGVSRLDRRHQHFERLVQDPADPLRFGPGRAATTVLEDSRGVLWIGTTNGLDRVMRSRDRFVADQVTHFTANDGSGFTGESVTSIIEDRRGTIWIGTAGGGLLLLTADEAMAARPELARFTPDPADPRSLASDAVLSLMEDPRGDVWIGTYRGLHRAVFGAREEGPEEPHAAFPSGFLRFRHDRDDETTLSADTIESLAAAPGGKLWVGTYRGLNLFDPKTGRVKRYLPDPLRPRSLSYEFVEDVHVDRRGDLWVATWGGGLCRLRQGSEEFELFGTREGLPSETVRDIAEDASGILWLATARGLTRLDPRNGEMRSLGILDGLHDDAMNALRWRRNGALIAAGSNGLTFFDPRRVGRDETSPPVVLTGLRVLNASVPIGRGILSKSIAFTDAITLGPRHYLFSIEFSALGFRNPEKLRYSHRLEGFDEHWIESTADERRAVYSNVPPGRYLFRVRAANADGLWSEQPASIAVTILPPWWKTWWARASALLLLVIAAASWPLIRLARERRLSAILEAKVTERTVQLEEANRKLDEASRTDPLTRLPNRRHFLEKAEEHLATFRRNGRPFAIALADVDNFKSVNDAWGHHAGDAVLRSVAVAFRSSLRESDLIARWGGEEFIFLLPETDSRGAVAVAEKAREAVASCPITVADETPLPVTVTVGVAAIEPGMLLDQCSNRADAALYAGKRSGKNRVVLA